MMLMFARPNPVLTDPNLLAPVVVPVGDQFVILEVLAEIYVAFLAILNLL
jgi:hypothetical protein